MEISLDWTPEKSNANAKISWVAIFKWFLDECTKISSNKNGSQSINEKI